MKTKLVSSALLEQEGRRLDCGPYLSGAIEAKLLLEKLSAEKVPLHKLTVGDTDGIFHAGREGRTWVEDPSLGVPFLSSSEVLIADTSRVSLMSLKQIKTNPQFLLRHGWTLITRSGTIGRMIYCRSDLDGYACSEHVLRVVPDSSKILPGYLFAFLSSKYGVPMVAGGTYGAIIQHIEPEHICNLPVPMPRDNLQKEVDELVQRAADLRATAAKKHAKAIAEMEDSLGLPHLSPHSVMKSPDIAIVAASSIGTRMDSMFHSNYHASVLDPLRSLPADSRAPVGELAESVIEPGRFRRVPIERGPSSVPFFGTSAIMRIDPDPAYYVSQKAPIAQYPVDDSTLLTPRSGQLVGLIGHVVLPYGDVLTGAVTEDAIRIHAVSKNTAGYLYVALSSEYGRRQLKARAFGSSIPHLDVNSIRHTIVPIVDQQSFDRIGSDGYSVAQMRHEAIQLERAAKAIVEKWITEGDES